MKLVMRTIIIIILVIVIIYVIARDRKKEITNPMQTNTKDTVAVDAVGHASLILGWDGSSIYADPVGADKYNGKPTPNIILITHTHPDHFDVAALTKVTTENTMIVVPQSGYDALPQALQGKATVMKNGDHISISGFS